MHKKNKAILGVFLLVSLAGSGYAYDDKAWDGFRKPKVELLIEAPEHSGVSVYLELVKFLGYADFSLWVQHCSEVVAQTLYDSPAEANARRVEQITYKLHDGGALSYKGGAPPHIQIGFDLNYLVRFVEMHGLQAAGDEVFGILCHEITHAYQAEPKNAGAYQKDTEFFGFIEGLADLVRLQTGGFNPPRFPVAGGSYTSGYTTTAFFYLWIMKTHHPNFLRDLNQSALEWEYWSLDLLCNKLFDKSAQDLWDDYQQEIDQYPWGP